VFKIYQSVMDREIRIVMAEAPLIAAFFWMNYPWTWMAYGIALYYSLTGFIIKNKYEVLVDTAGQGRTGELPGRRWDLKWTFFRVRRNIMRRPPNAASALPKESSCAIIWPS